MSNLGIPVEDSNSGTGGPNFIKLQSRSQSLEEEGGLRPSCAVGSLYVPVLHPCRSVYSPGSIHRQAEWFGGYRADRRILTPHITLRKLVQRGNRFPAHLARIQCKEGLAREVFPARNGGNTVPARPNGDLMIGGGGPDSYVS